MIDPTVIIIVVGVAAFAISGVIAGTRQDANILTVLVLGVVTAIGGGTVRDIILNIPVFWVGDFSVVWLAILASLVAFIFAPLFRKKLWKVLIYADAIGVAFFSVAAINKTLALGHTGEVAVIMGFVTACTGGILRDLLTGRPPMVIASEELFVTPVLIGGIIYVLLLDIAPNYAAQWPIVAICFIVGFRAIAIERGLQFPKWLRMRPGKRAE
ncbi:trimeric intracellular cation channel family protein [Methanogenium organophilum]|uniref:Trimeric intracellular cation channel family protein n=1 Tax=Methanogenium organophilum TaxID=2199 RepID=A0A9X9T6N0_METOG|nr:trimeric intracellular cation channel family protein [Methanogenium organophilum]WAI00204.1 trimeric intracellular cation channel family protein [Methanogenium organophilum]